MNVTRAKINAAELGLQRVVSGLPLKDRTRVHRAMAILNEIASDMRRKEIFAAGAKAKKPIAMFEHRQLGSIESCTFYDGYASTHPDFLNPYRNPYTKGAVR
jgi:hypothetical protein